MRFPVFNLSGNRITCLPRLPELLDVLVDHTPELRLHRRAFLPLAIGRERDRPDDGLVLVLPQILREALLVERLGRVDRRLDHLPRGVTVRRQIIAERVDLRFDGALGIDLEKLLGAGVIHARFRQPGVVVDDAVEQRPQIPHHGGELQADHAAAENLDVIADPDLVHGTQNAGRIRRVGRDIDDIGLGGLERTNDGRELDRVRRIGLIEDDGQVALLGDIAGGQRQVLGKLLIGREQRHVLAAGLLRQIDERGRPAVGRPPRRVVEPHVVADLAVHLEREIPHQQQAALLDERHDRRGRHRRVRREQQIDLVDIDQLGVDRRRLRGARLVVIDDQFDLAAEQPTLGIDIVAPDFDSEQRSLAAARKPAGLRHRHADLDRRLLRQCA